MSVSKRLRFLILERDQFSCRYCGTKAPATELQVDHVIPVSKGGSDDPQNLVASCTACNQSKKHHLIQYPAPGEIVVKVDELLLLGHYRQEVLTRECVKQMFINEESSSEDVDWESLADDEPENIWERKAFPDDFYEPSLPPIKFDFDWLSEAERLPSPNISEDELIPCFHGDN